jgi:hypothetical protein
MSIIFGPRKTKIEGEWRKLRKAKLNNCNSSLSVNGVVQSRRMGLAGPEARTDEIRNACSLVGET